MSITRSLSLVVAILLFACGAMAQDQALDRYIWQTYRTTQVAPSAGPLLQELRAEVQKVLDAGPLCPLRTVYADLLQDPYFLYWQPGRIITTLAMAYPHLTPAQQARVQAYVKAELDDAERAPWCGKGFIPPDKGARREIHSFNEPLGWDRYWGMWGRHKPIMGSFYGLWLYGDRSGDWETIRRHYPQIADLYRGKNGQCDVYGTMAAHIAMSRIALRMEDQNLSQEAAGNARAALAAGRNFAEIETRAKQYWKERYEQRQAGRNYQGWMFLEMSPEIGRFLAENVKEDVLNRHESALRAYPLFWLREAPYSTRWTGDEGVGIPTELMGMIVPIERWVAGAPAEKLAGYARSSPIGVGDCYWLEMLVNAIEATGKTQWQDVRK
jgi:hypothetical protein